MEPPLRSFNQEELSTAEEISLYSKLIDVIDKDVESIRSSDTRQGLTTWAILGAIVAGIGFFLGKTHDLTKLPTETTKVACAALVVFYLVLYLYNLLRGSEFLPKPGRFVDNSQYFRGYTFLLLLRAVILTGLSYLLLQTDFSWWSRVVSIVLLFIPVLIAAASVLGAKVTNQPMGNNPASRKVAVAGLVLTFLCYLVPGVWLGSQLLFPIGSELSDAFSLGMALSAAVAFFEVLLARATNTSNIPAYLDLRDDLVLRDIPLNDALERYRLIREGKSSWDELKPAFQRIIQTADHQLRVFDEQLAIIAKQQGAGAAEFEELSRTFLLHAETTRTGSEHLQSEIDQLLKKLPKILGVTGDLNTDQYVRNELYNAVIRLRDKEMQVNQANTAMFQARSLQETTS